ncbi:MAG: winged helix-turn-helix domain-containing protein [Ideonella sp.]
MSVPTPGPPQAPTGVMRFDRYALDLNRRQLLADGKPLPIGGRAFDLLDELVRQAGRTVSTDALRRAVWPDRKVGDNNLRVQITALRKLLGDGVITLHSTRGYRFTLPVLEEGDADIADSGLGNLPIHLPPLYGRDDDLKALAEGLVGQARITLAGPAGVGKTALARAAAHLRRTDPVDGVWWVDLAALGEASQLPDRIAALLQIKLQAEAPLDSLVRALADKRMLLVLDNCEHLSEVACELADALLRRAPRVAVLATSRRPLKCAGELLLRLGSLALPDGPGLAAARHSGAVVWFEARARRADPEFAVTTDNVEAVVDICQHLDGLAMAIGLAAARVPLLGVAGLRARLVDRFRLLTSDSQDPRGHPQALGAALDWSHELLAESEQMVLRRLGMFAGSFALDTVQALARDESLDDWAVLDALNALIDLSLVFSDPAALQSGAPMRYTMHESVRLYARQRLEASGEATSLRERHAREMLALVLGGRAVAAPPPDPMTVLLPDADHDNLLAAIAWAREHDLALALTLAVTANPYMRRRGHHLEARRIGAALLNDSRSADHPEAVVQLQIAQAAISFEQNDLNRTLELARAALGALSKLPLNEALLGEAWSWIGVAHQMHNEIDLAEPALRESLDHLRQAGRRADAASQLNNLGLLMVERRQFGEARALFAEALALNRELGTPWGTAMTLENLGEAAYAEGNCEAALAHWQEAVPIMRALGHIYQEAQLLTYIGQALRRLGQRDAALAHAREGQRISLARQLGGLVADGLTLLAALAADQHEQHRAAVLLCMADKQRGKLPAIGPAAIDRRETEVAVRSAIGEAAWQAARLEADRSSPAQVVG